MILYGKKRKLYLKMVRICKTCTSNDSDDYEGKINVESVWTCFDCPYVLEMEMLLDKLGLVEATEFGGFSGLQRWAWKTSDDSR